MTARPTSRILKELRSTVRLALPVVTVQLGVMLLGVVDTMTVGHVSEEALAAVHIGHSITLSLLLLPMGMLMALDPLVAQAFGARDDAAIGAHVRRGLILAVALAVPIMGVLFETGWLLRLFGQQEAIIPDAAGYMRIVSLGSIPFLVFVVFRQTLQAMGLVRPIVIAILVTNLVNLVGNQLLVFGRLGFPALGVEGSAWATTVSRWMLVVMVWWASRRRLERYHAVAAHEPGQELRKMLRLLAIGTPIGVHICFEVWVFVAVALLMGAWGVLQSSGHAIAINLASVVYMIPLGIAMAAAARVGQAIGSGDMPAARRAAASTLGLGAATQLVFSAVFIAMPVALGRLYTSEEDVLRIVATLLPIAAAFQLFDGLQTIAAGVLRGAGDTKVPAAIALFGYWIAGLPVGYALARWTSVGYPGYWWGLTIGLAIVAVALLLRIQVRFRGHIARLETSPTA